MEQFAQFAVSTLMMMSSLLGVKALPDSTKDWHSDLGWQQKGNIYYLTASSSTIAQECNANPEGFVSFPQVIHGAHAFYVDGALKAHFGDPTFKSSRSFYGAPVLSCTTFANGKEVEWRIYSYTKYFARFLKWPTFETKQPIFNVFAEILNMVAAGGLILLGIFSMVVFYKKVPHTLTFAVAASCLFTSIYFLCSVAGLMGIPTSMFALHKIADLSVWSGIGFLFFGLSQQGLVHKTFFNIYAVNLIVALIIIGLGINGDVIQFGTTAPFALTFGSFSVLLVRSGSSIFAKHIRRTTLSQFLSLFMFVSFGSNEMLVVTGLVANPPVLPIGMMFSLLFFALSVNQTIMDAYEERDFLRHNLEKEVQRKTHELRTKTEELEHAMSDLKHTQAELVQSAKLASLGTLSAGIAHEINNSLNYVNGSIPPFEKLVGKVENEETRQKMTKLLKLMKDGLNLTIEIIKSLKSYTGLNQAQFMDLSIKEVVKSVMTILGNKLRNNINVECDIDDNARVFGSVVGLNQVFMNIISNAVDAMPTGGQLKIAAKSLGDTMRITISDSGVGIPKSVKDRIFEPFFTTKEVGKGTGLGLHIVRNEIQKHKGNIKVESEENVGTTFIVELPVSTNFGKSAA